MQTIIGAIAIKEIDLAKHNDDLNLIQKRYTHYFGAVNKFLAVGGPVPYMDEAGKVCYETN